MDVGEPGQLGGGRRTQGSRQRVDAEVHHPPRLVAPAGGHQRSGVHHPEPFHQGFDGDRHRQPTSGLVGATHGEQAPGPQLLAPPPFGIDQRRGGEEGQLRQVHERAARPPRQGTIGPDDGLLDGPPSLGGGGDLDVAAEPQEVDHVRLGLEDVAFTGHPHVERRSGVAQRPPQPAGQLLHGLLHARRRIIAPEETGQAIEANRAPGVHGQHGQQPTGQHTADRFRGLAGDDPNAAQHRHRARRLVHRSEPYSLSAVCQHVVTRCGSHRLDRCSHAHRETVTVTTDVDRTPGLSTPRPARRRGFGFRRGVLAMVVTVASAAAGLVASAPPGAAVIDGTELTSESYAARWPWLVDILVTPTLDSCTGSLIGPRWVLTAGHCASLDEEFDVLPIAIAYGSPDNTVATQMDVVNHFVHPQYDRNTIGAGFDLALLELATDVPGPYAPLPRSATLAVGNTVTLAGWGRTNGFVSPTIARETTQISPTANDRVLIMQPVDGVGCFGDSGGPTMLERNGGRILVGVFSFGLDDRCEFETGSSLVAPAMDWITATTGVGPAANTAPSASPRLQTGAVGTAVRLDLTGFVDAEADDLTLALSGVPSTWHLLDPCTSATRPCRLVAPSAATVELTAQVSDGLATATSTITVDVGAPNGTGSAPAVVAPEPITASTIDSVQLYDGPQSLDDPDTADADLLVTVDPGDGRAPILLTGDSAPVATTYPSPGPFTSTITATDPQGNSTTVTRAVVIAATSVQSVSGTFFLAQDPAGSPVTVPVRIRFSAPLTSAAEFGFSVTPDSSFGPVDASVTVVVPAGATRATLPIEVPVTTFGQLQAPLVQLAGDPVALPTFVARFSVVVESGDSQTDLDGDGALDNTESPDTLGDADADDDGIPDGFDPARSDPDIDDDLLQDGTEIGLGEPAGFDTDPAVFRPDLDPATTTNPFVADTDFGGVADGTEDANRNGRVDTGENDPLNGSDDFNVADQPPAIAIDGAALAALEGEARVLSITATDPEGLPVELSLDVVPPPGVTCDLAGDFPDITVTCDDEGDVVVTVYASDGLQNSQRAAVLVVENVAPTVSVDGPTSGVAGTPVTLTATTADPGAADEVTCTTDWGDGSIEPGCAGTHTYQAASVGARTVTVTASDGDSGASVATHQITITSPTRSTLLLSETSSRTSGTELDGAAFDAADTAYVFVQRRAGAPSIHSTTFTIDGTSFSTDRAAPYDLAGTKVNGRAYGFDLSLLSAGTHEIAVTVRYADGTSEALLAQVTVAGPGSRALMVTPNRDRSGLVPLDGATVTGRVAIVLSPLDEVTDAAVVTFSVDGWLRQIQFGAPYDLAGGTASRATLFDTRALRPGQHIISATVWLLGGGTRTFTATFTIP